RSIRVALAAWGDAGPVLVTADHGHVDGGGHGGDEPIVRTTFALARGPGVHDGARAKGRAIDVAPTLSALLGVPAPSTSEGRALDWRDSPPPPPDPSIAAGAEHRRAQLAEWEN